MMISKENPGILMRPESQIAKNEIDMSFDFKGYQLENKILPGMERTMVILMIQENIEYERIPDIEDDWLSIKWLKVKISRKQSLMVM